MSRRTHSDDLKRYLAVAVAAAHDAGRISVSAFGRRTQVSYKGRIDPVTSVDRACERAIIKRLRRAFPSHEIISEEVGHTGERSDYKWHIDPVDGTVNYFHGFPHFCCSIGLESPDGVLVGVIYDPTRDELFSATKGGGAFLNGKPIRVSKISRLDRCLAATGFAYNIREARNKNMRHFLTVAMHCQGVRRPGSAGLDLAYVAAGRLDAFWEYNLKSWDVAAGALLVQEAGGRISAIANKSFTIYDSQIVATNSALHRSFRRLLGGDPVERVTPLTN